MANDPLSALPSPATSTNVNVDVGLGSDAVSVPTVVPAGRFSDTVAPDSVMSRGGRLLGGGCGAVARTMLSLMIPRARNLPIRAVTRRLRELPVGVLLSRRVSVRVPRLRFTAFHACRLRWRLRITARRTSAGRVLRSRTVRMRPVSFAPVARTPRVDRRR